MTSRDWWRDRVREPERVAAVERSGLLATGPEDAFDRLTELASVITGATRACITVVDADHYAYKSAVGVADTAPQIGPIEESFCRYVVGSSKPFVVDDARRDPRTDDNPAIQVNGVAAWAGYPIEDDAGWVLGTFCLITSEPYTWTDSDLHVLAALAATASSEIALRHAHSVIASALSAADDLRMAADAELAAATSRPHDDASAAILNRSVQLARELSDALRRTLAGGPASGPRISGVDHPA